MTKKKNPNALLPRGRRRIDGTAPGSTPADPSELLQLTLPASQKQWFIDEAKRQQVSASELFRRWLEEKR